MRWLQWLAYPGMRSKPMGDVPKFSPCPYVCINQLLQPGVIHPATALDPHQEAQQTDCKQLKIP